MNPIERILDVIAPVTCVSCGQEGALICLECSETISTLPSICYVCGRATKNYKPCTNCIGKNLPQHVWIYSEYVELIKEIIHQYKFESTRSAAQTIAGLIDETLPYFVDKPLITYVPTASSRRRLRGFDQSALLAKELAKIRKYNYASLLARQTQIRQLGSSREERKRQLKGAFRPINKHFIAGRHILLVDDVVTTGATIEACTKELLKAGALQVNAIVFARTPKR